MLINLEFQSNDKILKMNKSAEFKILEITGLESSDYTINSIITNQDGAKISSKRVEPREIMILGDISKNANEDINRKKLISFFNPKFEGILTVKRNNDSKKIKYTVDDFKFLNKKMSEFTKFQIILFCEDAYMESIDNFGKNIANITKQFSFPWIVTNKKIMGYKTLKNEVKLYNDGDTETGVEIEIKATGNIKNPKVQLNDEFIELMIDLKNGDVLKINTNKGKKTVRLNNQNVMQFLNRSSTFFDLKIGDNIMSYSSEDGYEYMIVNVYFTKKYLGV